MTGKAGLKRRGSKSTYGGTKVFNGERFTYLSTHKKQRTAQEQTMALRKGGMRSRTVIDRESGGKPVYRVFTKMK